jgi:hypothetical protein
LQQSLELKNCIGDIESQPPTLKCLAQLYAHHLGQVDEAITLLHQCLEIEAGIDHVKGIADTLNAIGGNNFRNDGAVVGIRERRLCHSPKLFAPILRDLAASPIPRCGESERSDRQSAIDGRELRIDHLCAQEYGVCRGEAFKR